MIKIDEYEKKFALSEDDKVKSGILFDLALVYRSMLCDKKAIDCYDRVQGLDVWDNRKEQAKEFTTGLLRREG